ncbi:preprotein translocase YidC [Microbacterium sp. SZ1]|uniref:YidC/Oxa1 family membrane protein insertase n=1 Tax=Microbacterium sp. SZ1 TaxID=1849736 RepID=UPI000BBBE35D|nr:membrane protein insertase YidC [Microbacterium sp. SZ1]PCE14486.1 preprotein translocase YidC [Microbacterium sp. SZ1]
MDIFAFPPLAALLDAAYGALAGLAALVEPFAGASAAALAVVLVTLLVRALLIPVGVSQAKAEQIRARLAPRLRDLQKRHKKNPERLQKEMMELYRSENTSPFAGMLPVLAQAPVVGLIYTLFLRPEIAGHPNDLLSHELFGAPLGTSLVSAVFRGTATPETFLVFGVLLAIIVAVAEVSRRVFRPAPVEGAEESPLNSPAMMRVAGALHYLTAVFAAFVPLAAALYLTVTVAWTLVQRMLLRRRYPLPAPSAGQSGSGMGAVNGPPSSRRR